MHRPFPSSPAAVAASVLAVSTAGVWTCRLRLQPCPRFRHRNSAAKPLPGGDLRWQGDGWETASDRRDGAAICCGHERQRLNRNRAVVHCAHDGRQWSLYRTGRLHLSIGSIATLRYCPGRQARGCGNFGEQRDHSADGAGTVQSNCCVKPDGGERGHYGRCGVCAFAVSFRRCKPGRQRHQWQRPGERGCDGLRAGRYLRRAPARDPALRQMGVRRRRKSIRLQTC